MSTLAYLSYQVLYSWFWVMATLRLSKSSRTLMLWCFYIPDYGFWRQLILSLGLKNHSPVIFSRTPFFNVALKYKLDGWFSLFKCIFFLGDRRNIPLLLCLDLALNILFWHGRLVSYKKKHQNMLIIHFLNELQWLWSHLARYFERHCCCSNWESLMVISHGVVTLNLKMQLQSMGHRHFVSNGMNIAVAGVKCFQGEWSAGWFDSRLS